MIEIEPGGVYVSGSHGEKTCEYINIIEGRLTLEIDGERYTVEKGDAMRFNTDKDHVYKNEGSELLSFNAVFYWR